MRVAGLSVDQVDRLSDEFEALVVREMNRAARDAASHLGAAMEARAATANVSQADVNVIFRLWEVAVRDRLLPALEDVWLAGANHQQAGLAEAVAALTAAVAMPGPDSDPGDVVPPPEPLIPARFISGLEAAGTFLSSAFNRLVGIGNELWAAARISLTEGMFAGESIPKLAARVRDSVGVTEPRATVIARTEVISAANAGSIFSMRSTRGLVTNKTWLATHDSRVRPTHIAAHDQTVPLNGRFTVGTASLDHPGDPFGPPEEIINCRCSMDYEVNMAPEALTAADVGPTTGMIALRPADPGEFTVDGGDTADELHVTMTFLGEVDDDLHEAARKAAQKVADAADGPLTARVAGFGVLGEEDAVVLFLNGDGLAEIQQALASEDLAAPDQWAPWICHMTLGYGIDIEAGRQFVGREFTIDALSVDVGDNHDRFVLGGGATTLPAAATGEASVSKRAFQLEEAQTARWRGVMVVEDTPTGDGREFAADALTWPDLPMPLQWQKETSHGGINDVTVTVGTIEKIEREGNTIIGEGLIDLGSEDGREVYRRISPQEKGGLGLGGVSIVADDPEQADVEYVYPAGCADLDDLTPEELDDVPLEELNKCLTPILVRYHSGRIRALTVVDTPAFVEAKIEIVDEAEVTAAVTMPVTLTMNGESYDIGEITSPDDLAEFLQTVAKQVTSALLRFTPVRSHETSTTDETWSKSDNEGRLDSPMPVSRAESMYAWIDRDAVDDGQVTKSACKFPHHMVGENGTPGAANLTACSATIASLNGARGGTDIPSDDREGVYNHVARHIRDAGEEPPELRSADDLVELEVDGRTFLIDPEAQEPPEELVAAAYTVTIPDLPSIDWYAEPAELPPIGAIKVTPEGRFYGLLGPRHVAHRGFANKRIEIPTGNVDYSRFMSRATPVALADGRVEEIPAGVVTMNCGHAKALPSVSADAALEHYDNSCSIVATIRIGENSKGVWVAGALMHGIEASDLARLLGCQLSGDWRPHPEKPGMRELTAALLVPVPGFASAGPTVRIENGELVAASAPIVLADDTSVQTFTTSPGEETVEEGSTEADTADEPEDTGIEDEAGETTAEAQRLQESRAAHPSSFDASVIADGYVEDLPDFDEALRANDPAVQADELAAELGLDLDSRLGELVASVKGDA